MSKHIFLSFLLMLLVPLFGMRSDRSRDRISRFVKEMQATGMECRSVLASFKNQSTGKVEEYNVLDTTFYPLLGELVDSGKRFRRHKIFWRAFPGTPEGEALLEVLSLSFNHCAKVLGSNR